MKIDISKLKKNDLVTLRGGRVFRVRAAPSPDFRGESYAFSAAELREENEYVGYVLQFKPDGTWYRGDNESLNVKLVNGYESNRLLRKGKESGFKKLLTLETESA